SHHGLPASWLAAVPFCMLGLAALMVSTLPFPKLRRRKSRLMNTLQLVNGLALYTFAPLRIFPAYLFALAALYPVGGVAWALFLRETEDEEEAEEASEAPAV